MNKKPILDRVSEFAEGKGFYIVLFLCVAAIGISGYYLFSTLSTAGEDTVVAAPTQVVVTPSATVAPVKPSVSPITKSTPQPSAAATPAPTSKASAAPKSTATPNQTGKASSVFTWPVKGQVIADFSLEVLAYDETMGDWRTHSGIDIASPVGTQVMAVTAGTVESVEQDDLMGTTVTISHANGLESVYANLAMQPTVEAGDHVETGAVIGAVGATAVAESARAPHLHLEMRTDGTSVDPINYLPQQ